MLNILLNNKFFRLLFKGIASLHEWKVFGKVFLNIIVMSVILFILYLFPLGIFMAPFYSVTTNITKDIKVYNKIVGETTIRSIQTTINDLQKETLVTNFIGIRNYIDNKYYEQVGQIEMIRIAMITIENNLARNRGTGGANKYLVQARADVYADYEIPIFTSYDTRLKQAYNNLEQYIFQLKIDQSKSMINKDAVFIVNSDNLAEVIDKLKQQLQTNIMIKSSFFTDDDKFYRLKGNLITMHNFLQGIEVDFKSKMKDKSSYEENFIPLMEHIENAIMQNHIVILESLGHLSKLEKEVNIIAQKLGELRDKLKNG